MSYQKSRAIRTTSIKDLILDRTFAGQGLGKSIVSSIKDKTVASVKGVTEKFDPLNIATAFGGSLGGYAMGKLTGRSSEDISYFTGRRVGGAKKNKNPLVTKVSDGDKRPTRKGEGLADILARIFNLLKNRMLELKKEQEITANFEEEKEGERELRHKELVDAISKIGGGTATPVGPVKEEKGLFGKLLEMMKNMIEKAFKAIKPILEFVESMMKSLGGNTMKFLKFLGLLGNMGVLSVLLPVGAALTLAWLLSEEKKKIIENPNDPKYKDTPLAIALRGEAVSEAQAVKQNQAAASGRKASKTEIQQAIDSGLPDKELIENYGASKEELKKWIDKTKSEPAAQWQVPVKDKAGNIVIKGGDTRENLRVTPDYLKTPEQKGNIPGGSEKPKTKNVLLPGESTNDTVTPVITETPPGSNKGAYLPGPSSSGKASLQSNQVSALSPPPSSNDGQGTVTSPQQSSSSKGNQQSLVLSPQQNLNNPAIRMQAAQNNNLSLSMEDDSPETIIIDKSKIINKGGDSGGLDILKSAQVRTDNRTLLGIQKQNIRFGPVALA